MLANNFETKEGQNIFDDLCGIFDEIIEEGKVKNPQPSIILDQRRYFTHLRDVIKLAINNNTWVKDGVQILDILLEKYKLNKAESNDTIKTCVRLISIISTLFSIELEKLSGFSKSQLGNINKEVEFLLNTLETIKKKFRSKFSSSEEDLIVEAETFKNAILKIDSSTPVVPKTAKKTKTVDFNENELLEDLIELLPLIKDDQSEVDINNFIFTKTVVANKLTDAMKLLMMNKIVEKVQDRVTDKTTKNDELAEINTKLDHAFQTITSILTEIETIRKKLK